jgi:hypothetical protein
MTFYGKERKAQMDTFWDTRKKKKGKSRGVSSLVGNAQGYSSLVKPLQVQAN